MNGNIRIPSDGARSRIFRHAHSALSSSAGRPPCWLAYVSYECDESSEFLVVWWAHAFAWSRARSGLLCWRRKRRLLACDRHRFMREPRTSNLEPRHSKHRALDLRHSRRQRRTLTTMSLRSHPCHLPTSLHSRHTNIQHRTQDPLAQSAFTHSHVNAPPVRASFGRPPSHQPTYIGRITPLPSSTQKPLPTSIVELVNSELQLASPTTLL